MRLGLFLTYMMATCFIGTLLPQLLFSTWLYALVTLPGTFLHELMHWTAALLLQGDPGMIHLIPSGDTLGYVLIAPNWYNAATIACAPFLLAPLTGFFIAMATRVFSLMTLVYIYLASCSWAACVPSSQDFDIARSYPASWPVAIIILLVATYLWVQLTRRIITGSRTSNRASVLK